MFAGSTSDLDSHRDISIRMLKNSKESGIALLVTKVQSPRCLRDLEDVLLTIEYDVLYGSLPA